MANYLKDLNNETEVIVQGITGKEGERVTDFMQKAGTKVVAGVRPGKAGEEVLGVPVYDTVADTLESHPNVLISCVYVPPKHVLAACTEALEAGVKFLHVIAEGVPVQDTAKLIQQLKEHNAQLLGPASLGLIIPEVFKLGSLGGEDNSSYSPGSVGLISRSGGMSSEMAFVLTKAALGQSAVVHVGGDYLIGTTLADAAEFMEQDDKTKLIAIVGEAGGSYEYKVINMIKSGRLTKPVVVFLAGQFLESLPEGVPLGHAGAIISDDRETRAGKTAAFEAVGATVVSDPAMFVEVIKSKL